MPQVKIAPTARRDIQRLLDFLQPKSLESAKQAAVAISRTSKLLEMQPFIGREVEGTVHREILVTFGNSGYVMRYTIKETHVLVTAVRHQREAGYHSVR